MLIYSAGIDFSRQNLTSTDVRLCRLKSVPALYGLELSNYSNQFQITYLNEMNEVNLVK